MAKLKLGIQPSTSLLVCKRACCLRWLESPVCHIHDVFPETRNILQRGTIYVYRWQHPSLVLSLFLVSRSIALYRPPRLFHPFALCSSLFYPFCCSTVSRQPAVRLHCVERYVNMSTQLGYLPFLRRQFEVNSSNWLLSMLCLCIRCYVPLYGHVHFHEGCIQLCMCVFGIVDYIIRHDARMETRLIVR